MREALMDSPLGIKLEVNDGVVLMRYTWSALMVRCAP